MLQPLKASYAISSRDFGKVTELKRVKFSNALLPIYVIPSAISTDFAPTNQNFTRGGFFLGG